MASFIERYQAGERQQVWADLNSLGQRVREKPYVDDAYAVAKETMRRARGNVETLIVRLEKLGYQFPTNRTRAEESRQGLEQAMAMMKAMTQVTAGSPPNPHVDRLRERSRSILENPLLAGLLGKLTQKASSPEPADDESGALGNHNVFLPPDGDAPRTIRAFEKEIGGTLPLSLRAWCEIVGSVSLVGTHPVLCFRAQPRDLRSAIFVNPSMVAGPGGQQQLDKLRARGINVVTTLPTAQPTVLADPLVVDGDPAAWEGEYEDGEARSIPLAPDDLHKADVSGSAYYMDVPCATADAIFQDWHNANFVDYLRIAFRWGGFPGWERYAERPEKELAYLAEGLLPI